MNIKNINLNHLNIKFLFKKLHLFTGQNSKIQYGGDYDVICLWPLPLECALPAVLSSDWLFWLPRTFGTSGVGCLRIKPEHNHVHHKQRNKFRVSVSEFSAVYKCTDTDKWRNDAPRTRCCCPTLPPRDAAALSAVLTCSWEAWLPSGVLARRPCWLCWAAAPESGRITSRSRR